MTPFIGVLLLVLFLFLLALKPPRLRWVVKPCFQCNFISTFEQDHVARWTSGFL